MVQRRLHDVGRDSVQVCSVTVGELWFGVVKSPDPSWNASLLTRFLSQFHSLPFDDSAANVFGRIRSELEGKGMKIGPYDLIIAAIAISHELTLVTHNTKEFARVRGLQIEDWQTP